MMETTEQTRANLHTRNKSLYDFKIGSADGTTKDIFADCKGKVTLLFNCAAGCGNIPQHSVLRRLDELHGDSPDFKIQAMTVDDFTCHGYVEYAGGLDKYIDDNDLDLTPGMVAQNYATDNYGVKYKFSELTNGRFDKHTYDPKWVPGGQYEQEPHDFWKFLLGSDTIDRDENNLPNHWEISPWSETEQQIDKSVPGFIGLQANFEKFLIDRTGTRFVRYSSSFLLGERDRVGEPLSWWKPDLDDPRYDDQWPNEMQGFGIDWSLHQISRDINAMLTEDWEAFPVL
jgi:glutathione peroxidase-family protein